MAPGFAVETARKRSPEKCDPVVPVRASPRATRRAKASTLVGEEGSVGDDDGDAGTRADGSREELGHGVVIRKVGTQRDAGDHQLGAGAEVGLEEDADGVLGVAVLTTRDAVVEPPL